MSAKIPADLAACCTELFAETTALCNMVESATRTRNPADCERIALQADAIRRTAHRARLAMLAARTAEVPPDAA